MANYYAVTGQPQKARALCERIVAGTGWNAFGDIAAEADPLTVYRFPLTANR